MMQCSSHDSVIVCCSSNVGVINRLFSKSLDTRIPISKVSESGKLFSEHLLVWEPDGPTMHPSESIAIVFFLHLLGST